MSSNTSLLLGRPGRFLAIGLGGRNLQTQKERFGQDLHVFRFIPFAQNLTMHCDPRTRIRVSVRIGLKSQS